MRSQAQNRTGKESNEEKRIFSRVPCLVDLEVIGAGTPPTAVEAVDLSLLGVGFTIRRPETKVEIGEQVEIGMHGLRTVRGQVRWNHGGRVGVQFRGRFQDIVDSWVGEVLAAQGVRLGDLVRVE